MLGVFVPLPKLYFPVVQHSESFTAKDILITLETVKSNKGMNSV